MRLGTLAGKCPLEFGRTVAGRKALVTAGTPLVANVTAKRSSPWNLWMGCLPDGPGTRFIYRTRINALRLYGRFPPVADPSMGLYWSGWRPYQLFQLFSAERIVRSVRTKVILFGHATPRPFSCSNDEWGMRHATQSGV